jgi:hypothetical protein
MAEVLEYGRGVPRRSKFLVCLANVTLVFPLMVVGSFYVEWLAACYFLGHVPRPTLDDPKDIAGLGVLDDVLGVVLLVMSVAALVGMPVTGIYAVKGQFRAPETIVRFVLFVTFWVGAFVMLVADPWGVMYWWFD